MIKLKSLFESIEDKFLEGLTIDDPSPEDINNIKTLGGKNIPFQIGNMKYKLEINLSLFKDEKIADIKFLLLNNPKTPKKDYFRNDQQYQIAFRKSQVGITDTGNPFKVLSKVLLLLNYYLKEENIRYICFTADEENRQRLYQRILGTMLLKYKIPYKQILKSPLNGKSLNSEEFWIEKI